MTATTEESRTELLARSVREIRRLRGELDAARQTATAPIAVVGMACRMPGGARQPAEFWDFLSRGGDGIGPIPADRWESADAPPDASGAKAGRSAVCNGAFLDGIDQFDAPFFGISPREAAWLDPQQRLLLEAGWEALEHAGIAPDRLAGTRGGVFVGVTNYDYSQRQVQQVDPDDLESHFATGNASTFAAGRLSYWLGMHGPSLSVDTACSSSLVAVHLACQSLRAGDCTTALAGGVNILLAPEQFAVLSKTGALAPDGRCKTFDKAADGYARGEGCAVVVLRKLSDAIEQGDRVLAVIRGSAVNHDGRSSGVTVPNPAAQQAVVRAALQAAAVAPAQVDYVEAHGTGTPLGDPIELRALGAVFADREGGEPLRVGSVKTNVGHLEPAAGVAGLVKLVLALQHEAIPPHRNLSEINPEIGIETLPVRIPTELTPWPRGARPRIAGLSSFGASGTNAHLVIEEAPEQAPAAADHTADGEPEARPRLLAFSAKSTAALGALAARYRDRLADAAPDELADICFTAGTGRAHFPYRMAVVGASPGEIRDRLAAYSADAAPPAGVVTGRAPAGRRPAVAFLFTGQGAQYPRMAAGVWAGSPVFREVMDRADQVLRPLLGRALSEIVLGDGELIHRTSYTQPALFAVEYALAELWRSWGIVPSAVMGHSVGELTAACVAGALEFEDGLRLAAHRGRLMDELCEPGAMAAVFAAPDVVERALRPFTAGASIAAVNGPESVVVSGSAAAVGAVVEALAAQGVRTKQLTVGRPFHSPLIEPMLDAFEAVAAEVRYATPRIPLYSNLTGERLSGPDALSARYLREHVREPVRFMDGARNLFENGHRTLLEVGPAPSLLGMAKRLAPADGGELRLLPSLRPNHDDLTVLAESLGALYTEGFAVSREAFEQTGSRHKVELPSYPFQHERHWFRPTARPVPVPGRRLAPASADLLGHRIPSPLNQIQYTSRLSADEHACLGDCVVDGLPVVNVGVYLEAAFQAARRLYGPGVLLAQDVLVLQSLVLGQGERLDAQLVLDAEGETSARFGYHAEHSQAGGAEGGGPWILHARGKVAAVLNAAEPASDGEHAPAAIRDRLPSEMTGTDFYRGLWRRKLYLGPEARWVEQLWYGPDEAVARMRLPEAGETERYLLHPGLADAMFQCLFACLPEDVAPEAVFALVGIERFVLRGYDASRPVYCHATLLPGTDPAATLAARIRLVDESGRTLVEADGVYAKRAERESVLRASSASASTERAPAAVPAAVPGTVPTQRSKPGPEHSKRPEPAEARELLAATVARVLRSSAADLDPDEPLQGLGLDSLMALEVKDTLTVEFGLELPLVAFLDGSSITKLGDLVVSMLGLPAAPASPGAATDEEAIAEPAGLPVIEADPDARYEPFPLTDLQQAYLVGRTDAFALGNVSTYFFLEVDLEELDLERLGAAFRQVVSRHDMLRAVVTPDGYQRVLADVPEYRIRTADLTGLDEAERERRLDLTHEQMSHQVLDTATWPMFDIRASLIDERRTRLHVGFDALIMDAWSTSLVFDEWARLYGGEDLPPTASISYRDYVLAMRRLEGGTLHRRSADYWQERLPTLPPAPDLPLAKNPELVRRPEFAHRTLRVEAEDWARFKANAAAVGVTTSAALCTAYSQVLAAWSRSGRFTLNILFFNRLPLHPEVGELVGNFTATTLLEVDSTPTRAFADRAEGVQRRLWSDLEHCHVSGVQVLRELSRARGGSARVTMPVVFASTVNFATREGSSTAGLTGHLLRMGESGREVWNSIRTPQVWLDHQAMEEDGALIVNWDAVEEIFPDGMVDAMYAAYLGTLRELCEDPEAWHRPAPVLTPAAELAQREERNATAAPVPAGLLHEGFLARAAAEPERTAVIAPGRTIGYGELDRRSDRLARQLRERGVGRGALVGVVMHKGWEQVEAVIAILKAGGAYVPIDAAVPLERLRLLLGIAGIGAVVTQPAVAAGTEWPEGVAVLVVGGADDDGDGEEDDRPLGPAGSTPDDLAYVIYTSGSTGTPKGVMIEHRGALNTVVDVNQRFGITPEDRVLALSALNFDLSVYDVFGLLSAGGAVVLPEPAAHREPARWLELVVEHGVTVWNSVPALAEMFAEHTLANPSDRELPLRTVMMSGDWIPVTLPARLRALAPNAALWSLGGATEASIWSILHPIVEADGARVSIPYGRPMLNQRFHVLDGAMRPCPVWAPGNLYIAGIGLARGYLGDEAKTAAAFVRHPVTGERLYRTGDLGRYLPGGDIEFLGREDFQVKIQGYRIELGEVESALLRCPGVQAAAAAAVGERRGPKRLVGYVVLDDPAADAESMLRETLGRDLPDYLVPQRILVLDELPLSANGKVNRAELPSPDDQGADGAEIVAPRDEVERRLARIWASFFESQPISVRADFFGLGGDSLLAVRLTARIRAEFGRSLPLSTLFSRPTIELLAQALREADTDESRTALVPVRTGGALPALFLVHPVGGDVLCYAELVSGLVPDQPVYALQVPDLDEPAQTMPALAAHYAEAVAGAAPRGPIRLAGWSMGGVIALEIARRLDEDGREVDLVALVDPIEPPGPAPEQPLDEADLLIWFARDLAGIAGREWLPRAEDLRAEDGRTPLDVLCEQAHRLEVLPADIDAATLGRIFERFSRNARVLAGHAPAPYAGRVRLYRAQDGGASVETAKAWLSLLTGDATVTDLPGDHYTVMRAPHVAVLAAELCAALGAER